MRILIVGAGAVGFHLSRHLSEEGHDIVLVDQDAERVSNVQDQLDIMGIAGNGASLGTLERAGIAESDLLIAGLNVWPTRVTELQVNYVYRTQESLENSQLLVNAQVSF